MTTARRSRRFELEDVKKEWEKFWTRRERPDRAK
jgi:hypothetical protein